MLLQRVGPAGPTRNANVSRLQRICDKTTATDEINAVEVAHQPDTTGHLGERHPAPSGGWRRPHRILHVHSKLYDDQVIDACRSHRRWSKNEARINRTLFLEHEVDRPRTGLAHKPSRCDTSSSRRQWKAPTEASADRPWRPSRAQPATRRTAKPAARF